MKAVPIYSGRLYRVSYAGRSIDVIASDGFCALAMGCDTLLGDLPCGAA